jgi:hypothetical protein
MANSKTPQQEPFPLRHTEEILPKVTRFCPIPTADLLKKTKLFGIPLCSSITQEELSDEAIEFYINTAISEIEHTLDLAITPVTYREKHDYRRHNFTWNYNYLKVDHPNILYVSKIELSFSNNDDTSGFVQFPLEHVHVQPQEGVVQLVPAFGTSLSGFLLSAFSGTQFHALRATGITDFPGGIRIEYTAGFAPDKVPYLICQAIEVMAAINVLSALGPVLFPQTSTSIGIDGTSQSVGTFGPKHLNDRIAQLETERERTMESLKGYYQRRFLVDYF